MNAVIAAKLALLGPEERHFVEKSLENDVLVEVLREENVTLRKQIEHLMSLIHG